MERNNRNVETDEDTMANVYIAWSEYLVGIYQLKSTTEETETETENRKCTFN